MAEARAPSDREKGLTAVPVVHEAGRVVGCYALAPTTVAPPIDPHRPGTLPSPQHRVGIRRRYGAVRSRRASGTPDLAARFRRAADRCPR